MNTVSRTEDLIDWTYWDQFDNGVCSEKKLVIKFISEVLVLAFGKEMGGSLLDIHLETLKTFWIPTIMFLI